MKEKMLILGYEGEQLESMTEYNTDNEGQFTYFPPEKTMYKYEGDLLMQITHLIEDYGGSWDTLTCYKFEYDEYGNLILWERINGMNGTVLRSEYKYIKGEGNHAVVFPKESNPNHCWRCWYPYPVYNYSIS